MCLATRRNGPSVRIRTAVRGDGRRSRTTSVTRAPRQGRRQGAMKRRRAIGGAGVTAPGWAAVDGRIPETSGAPVRTAVSVQRRSAA